MLILLLVLIHFLIFLYVFMKTRYQIFLDVFQELNLDIFYFHIFLVIENMGFMIIEKKEIEIYNFFNSIINKLQLILMNK